MPRSVDIPLPIDVNTATGEPPVVQNASTDIALLALENGAQPFSENIREIVNRIAPAISELVDAQPHHPELMHMATRANVRHSVAHLRHASAVIERRIAEGRLSVTGAEYSHETGVVDFFDLP